MRISRIMLNHVHQRMFKEIVKVNYSFLLQTERTFHNTQNLLRKFGGQKQMTFKTSSRRNRPQSIATHDDDESFESSHQQFDYTSQSSDESIEEISKITKRDYFLRGMGHQVLVVQPKNWKMRNKMQNTVYELRLQEAVALAETLPNWKVIKSYLLASISATTNMMFGRGNLKMLKDTVSSNENITALFINTSMLNGRQHHLLENFFKVPVYDRYTIVLQIFKIHANTREAILQVALAEIPYLRSRLTEMHRENRDWHNSSLEQIGGTGSVFISTRKQVLKDKEIKIKSILENLKSHREFLRKSRQKKNIPIVAVVGYTNSGKTSLIKALTDQEKLIPKDQLFATLDVTAHAGKLPCNLEVLYMDTVGFISEIPTSLIASFNATLEDILQADVIVHVRDLSHPESEYQKSNVLETLNILRLPKQLMESIIEVNNKIDKCDEEILQSVESGTYNISATQGDGLAKLLHGIEEGILSGTNQVTKLFRVRIGSEQEKWLRRAGGIKEVMLDKEKENFYVMRVVLPEPSFRKFCHHFNVGKVKIS